MNRPIVMTLESFVCRVVLQHVSGLCSGTGSVVFESSLSGTPIRLSAPLFQFLSVGLKY